MPKLNFGKNMSGNSGTLISIPPYYYVNIMEWGISSGPKGYYRGVLCRFVYKHAIWHRCRTEHTKLIF